MKVREGFVSNSSSSSFVILGARLTKAQLELVTGQKPDDPDEFWEIIDEFNLKMKGNTGIFGTGYGDGVDDVLGISIANGSDYALDTASVAILPAIEKVKKLFKKFKLPEDLVIKVYTGERSS